MSTLEELIELEPLTDDECDSVSCDCNPFKTATDPKLLAKQREDAIRWAEQGIATGAYDSCQRCGRSYGRPSPHCRNAAQHAGR